MNNSTDVLGNVFRFIAPYALNVWQYLDSNFSAALFGALAGALGAHFIAARSERRRRLLSEISGVNNAIELSNTIANTFLAIKRQHVKSLGETYARDFEKFAVFLSLPRPPPPAPPALYVFVADFRTFPMPLTPVVELRETILNRIQTSVRAISISIPLHQCIDSFATVLGARVAVFQRIRALPDADKVAVYFGLRTSAGDIDETYPDLMLGLCNNVDDAIYFSILLEEILVAHGNTLAKRYGRASPKILKIDNSNVPADLLPDRANYPDFERIFRAIIPPHSVLNNLLRRATAVWSKGSKTGSK